MIDRIYFKISGRVFIILLQLTNIGAFYTRKISVDITPGPAVTNFPQANTKPQVKVLMSNLCNFL